MAEAAGWRRFRQVTDSVPGGHRLYRASAPNYKTRDSDQDLTQAAVDFLVDRGIDSIISFNTYEYNAAEKARLADAVPPIRYLHLRLGDFKPPTLGQFKQANDFFLQNASTLVHCGYGWGRTGTGITGLQIYAENGRSLEPLAQTWPLWLAVGGNNVEKREQLSVLSEHRNLLLPRITGTPGGDPQQAYAIINFGTGYYLTLSTDDRAVVSLSPETVEATPTIEQACQWVIPKKDDRGSCTLSNKTALAGFALTEPGGAKIDDPVTYGAQAEGNAVFTIKEVASGDRGRYVISPEHASTLAVAIHTPSNTVPLVLSHQMPALLAPNDADNKLGLWILLPLPPDSSRAGQDEIGAGQEG